MRDTGIVVVTHNSAGFLGPCLDQALAACASVVVVDNASTDSTLDEARRRPVEVVVNLHNRGFAAAANQGVRSLDRDFIVLINPDAILETGLDPLRRAFDDPRVAGATGQLVDPARVPQTGFNFRRLPTPAALAFEALLINRLWRRNPVNWHYRCLDLNPERSGPVEQPAAALLMFRRAAWERIGGFDESFFPVWFEDVDFCKRLRDHGYLMMYVPAVVAKHTGGHSVHNLSLESGRIYWYGNLLRYASKHFRPGAARAVGLAVVVGSLVRMLIGVFGEWSLKPVAVYGTVLRLAGRFVWLGHSAQ
ncbi:MAG: glycosyltransferase family 2 protein [Bryobacteraceae bacterium]